jgi:hypothetical protein
MSGESVKIMRILAVVLLSFLYVGGTVAHVYGAAFPITGSGTKTVDGFQGKTKDPLKPIITECRHIPLVKGYETFTPAVLDQPSFGREVAEERVQFHRSPLLLCIGFVTSWGERAPPLS